MRIPSSYDLSGFYIRLLADCDQSTVRELIALTLTAVGIINDELTGSRYNN
jgi:hypothetical protein